MMDKVAVKVNWNPSEYRLKGLKTNKINALIERVFKRFTSFQINFPIRNNEAISDARSTEGRPSTKKVKKTRIKIRSR
jgi:hypothetical protein